MALTPGLAAWPSRATRTDPKTRLGPWRRYPSRVSQKVGCVRHNAGSASRDQRRYVDDRQAALVTWMLTGFLVPDTTGGGDML